MTTIGRHPRRPRCSTRASTPSETLVGYLSQQLAAIRSAAHGLSEHQARQTPCRSALSIGGLVKHATYVMEQRERRETNPEVMLDDAGIALFMGSFALRETRRSLERSKPSTRPGQRTWPTCGPRIRAPT